MGRGGWDGLPGSLVGVLNGTGGTGSIGGTGGTGTRDGTGTAAPSRSSGGPAGSGSNAYPAGQPAGRSTPVPRADTIAAYFHHLLHSTVTARLRSPDVNA